jgi:hypothetical protein
MLKYTSVVAMVVTAVAVTVIFVKETVFTEHAHNETGTQIQRNSQNSSK